MSRNDRSQPQGFGRIRACVPGRRRHGTARALACTGRETLVIERNRFPGEETTSRNSGVIHSGLYYRRTRLKPHESEKTERLARLKTS